MLMILLMSLLFPPAWTRVMSTRTLLLTTTLRATEMIEGHCLNEKKRDIEVMKSHLSSVVTYNAMFSSAHRYLSCNNHYHTVVLINIRQN